MRTLKKTLCLVLCLAMMVGLVAISASAADFPDAEDVENKEEMGLLVGLGVVKGTDDDGDGEADRLNPAGTLTRAEAALIIYRLLTGNVDADPAAATTPFSDMAGYGWASGAIAFCADKGIIAGYGDGRFGPGDTLTGAQFGKMLLCALGYDAEKEGLVGNGWDLNVTKWVKRTGLADAAEFGSGTDEISRDFACKMAFNSLTVPMVEYDGLGTITTTDTTIALAENLVATGDYLAENFGMAVSEVLVDENGKPESRRAFAAACTVTGVVTENGYNALNGAVTVIGNTAVKAESGEDLLARYVIAYKDTKGNVLSMTEIGSVKEVAKAADNAKAAFGAAVKFADAPYQFAAGNYDAKAAYKIADDAEIPAGTYVFDNTGKVVAEIYDYEIVTLDTVTKVDTTAGKEAITLAAAGKLENNADKDEVREYDGIAAKDIVVATKVGAVTYLEKAETVDGAISKYDTKTKAITLEGTVYSKSAATDTIADPVAPAGITTAQMKANTYTLYLVDGEYVRVVVKEAEVAPFTAYYVISVSNEKLKVDSTTSEATPYYYATVVDLDGATSNVTFRNDGKGQTVAEINALVGTIVKITDGDTKDVKKLQAFGAAELEAAGYAFDDIGTLTMAANANTIKDADAADYSAYVKADTKFVFVDAEKGTAEVKTGSVIIKAEDDLPAIAVTSEDSDENAVAKTIFVGGTFVENAAIDPSTILYLTGANKKSTTADGLIYTVYDVVTGEAKEITVAGTKSQDGKAGFYTFTEKDGITSVSDAYLTDADTALVYDAVYSGKYENSIRLNGEDKDIDASKAIFVDLTGGDTAIDSIAALAKAEDVTLDILFDKNGAISIIFVKAVEEE